MDGVLVLMKLMYMKGAWDNYGFSVRNHWE